MLAICEHNFCNVTKDFTAFFDEGFVRKSVFAVNGLCMSRFFAKFAKPSILRNLYMDAIKIIKYIVIAIAMLFPLQAWA